MEEELRKKIVSDYLLAQKNITNILKGGPNFFVKSIKQYLTPTIITQECDLTDERGELIYYKTIRNVLEKLLIGKQADYVSYFDGAPTEIRGLLSKKVI